MRLRTLALPTASLLAAVLACGTMTVDTEYAPDTDWAAQQTYRWTEVATLGVADTRLDTAHINATIRDAVQSELWAKGYEQDTTAPNFLIDYHAILEHRMVQALAQMHPGEADTDLVSIGPGNRYAREFDVGTLVIDMIEPSTERVIWRGSARDEVDWTLSQEKMDRRIRDAVKQILQRFPPT